VRMSNPTFECKPIYRHYNEKGDEEYEFSAYVYEQIDFIDDPKCREYPVSFTVWGTLDTLNKNGKPDYFETTFNMSPSQMEDLRDFLELVLIAAPWKK